MIPRFAICNLQFAICNRRSLARCQFPIALALPLLFALPALAQRSPPKVDANGTEVFRALLTSYKLKPLSRIDELRLLKPSEVLIVSFRSSDTSDKKADWFEGFRGPSNEKVREYVEKGGAVLFASDRKSGWTDSERWYYGWVDDFAFRIDGRKVVTKAGTDYYRQYECPFVDAVDDAQPNLFRSDRRQLLQRSSSQLLRRVATNKPSYFNRNEYQFLATLATFRGEVRLEEEGENFTRKGLRFALGGQVGDGRILVLSDQSVFINSMLLPPPGHENDNLDFTFNCLDWLTEAKEGKRKYVMFVDDGEMQTDFSLILKSLPPQTPEQIMDYLREHPDEIVDYLRKHPELIWNNLDKASPLVATLEEEGVFDEIEKQNLIDSHLLEYFHHWVFVRNALILGALLLLGYGVRRFVASKQNAPPVPRFSVALERFRPRVGLLDQRLREGFRAGEHYEEARERARAMFAEMGLAPAAEGPPPAFEIQASWWARRRIEADLREIWRVAHGPEPEPISEKKWQKWPARLRFLRDQIRAGRVRFLT